MALGRSIVQHWYGGAPQLEVMTLDAKLEQMLMQALTNGGGMEPGLADTLLAAQRAWIAFRDAECTLAYDRYGSGSMRVIAAAVDAPNTASAATKIATMGQERAGTRSPGSGRACRDRVGADGDSSAVVAIRSPSSMLIGRGHATNRDSSRQGTPGPSPCALRTHPAGGNPVGMGFSLT